MATKLRVGFDISQVAHPGGVAVYTENLARELSRIEDLEMVYFYSSLRRRYSGGLRGVKKALLPPSVFEVMFNRLRIVSIERFVGKVDIFHSSDWVQPKTRAKKVTTYHDLVPLIHPEWSTPQIVNVARRRLRIVESEIDQVIAVSNSVKSDLLKETKIPESKITVIYEGVEEFFCPQKDDGVADFKRKYKLPDKYVLAIGGVGERRNLARVMEAARGYNLVITGRDLFVERKEMPLLYGGALVLFYPSLYEGFGLPILEAFASGCPVITGNVSGMAEVSKGCALEVDPMDVSKIKKALDEVLGDVSLRKELVKKGFGRVRDFSWKKAAVETAKVYRGMVL